MVQREQEIINNVKELLVKELNPQKIIHFGSRVKENNGKHSDFDFAIDAPKPDITLERKLNEEIDKICGLYKVDLVYLDSVDEEFKNIILDTGKVIYEKRN